MSSKLEKRAFGNLIFNPLYPPVLGELEVGGHPQTPGRGGIPPLHSPMGKQSVGEHHRPGNLKAKLRLETCNLELEPVAIVIRCFLQKGFGCVMLGKPLLSDLARCIYRLR